MRHMHNLREVLADERIDSIMHLSNVQTPQDQWQADAWWFHCFRALIDGGQLARMSGSSCKVYFVIKSHANYKNGLAGPAIPTIALKSGLSVAQVKRELTSLGKSGLLRKQKSGRHNVYQIVEHFPVIGSQGTPVAMGQWEYIPAKVSAVMEELKQSVAAQSMDNGVLIRIDKSQLQVIQRGSQGVQIGDIDLESMPLDLRKSLERLLASVGKRQATSTESDTYT